MPVLRSKHGPHPSVVAGRIKAERERLGIPLRHAARLLGLAPGSYRRLEVTANPQLSTLIALVTVLGMDARAIAPELFEVPSADR